ncbi:hypothetical protein [Sphingomonas koreensis]|uniref:hypothetical protein n=1 Tax=Sphingomonas koreensis TaxID=93064 RepID=UPI0012EE675D|nr:hypothetical protein [Sphingomonas koreensis]
MLDLLLAAPQPKHVVEVFGKSAFKDFAASPMRVAQFLNTIVCLPFIAAYRWRFRPADG